MSASVVSYSQEYGDPWNFTALDYGKEDEEFLLLV